VQTSLGVVQDAAPVSYQRIGDERVAVESRYKLLEGEGGYGFAVGAYDPRYPLVIDPGLDYSAFLGGTNQDGGNGIAVREGRGLRDGEDLLSRLLHHPWRLRHLLQRQQGCLRDQAANQLNRAPASGARARRPTTRME
jgi:hypothetical protein